MRLIVKSPVWADLREIGRQIADDNPEAVIHLFFRPKAPCIGGASPAMPENEHHRESKSPFPRSRVGETGRAELNRP